MTGDRLACGQYDEEMNLKRFEIKAEIVSYFHTSSGPP